MGFSTGEWNGDILTITTTHIKAGYFRRSGVPASDRTTVVEHWMRHGNAAVAGDDRHRSGLSDRAVHPQPGVRADGARQHELALQLRVRDGGADGQERGAALPARPESVAAASSRPSTRCRRKACAAAPRRCCPSGSRARKPLPPSAGDERRLPARACSRRSCRRARCRAVHVQGNVHMIVGAGANIAVQVGDDGVLVVDTGRGGDERQGAGGDQGSWRRTRRSAGSSTPRCGRITPAATSRSRRRAARSTATSPRSSRTRTPRRA